MCFAPAIRATPVKEVQTLLTSYGYYSGKINGSYNTATTTAVRNFQRYNSLTVDGKVGPKTMAVLKSGNAVSAPLKPNETNNSASVKMVQTLLRDLGYYNGKIDGKYGKATTPPSRCSRSTTSCPSTARLARIP